MLLLNYPSKGPNFGRDSHFSNGGSGSNEHKTGPGPGQARRPTKTHCRISPRAREVPFGVRDADSPARVSEHLSKGHVVFWADKASSTSTVRSISDLICAEKYQPSLPDN